MYTVDNAIIHVFSVAYSDTNINNMDMDYEIETVWKFTLFQIENKVIKAVRMYTNTVHMYSINPSLGLTCTPPTLSLTHLMMMVREDSDLPPFSSSTYALVAVLMAVRLALPSLTT